MRDFESLDVEEVAGIISSAAASGILTGYATGLESTFEDPDLAQEEIRYKVEQWQIANENEIKQIANELAVRVVQHVLGTCGCGEGEDA